MTTSTPFETMPVATTVGDTDYMLMLQSGAGKRLSRAVLGDKLYDKGAVVRGPWFGKHVGTIGDSITATAQDGVKWADVFATAQGVTLNNQAVSGVNMRDLVTQLGLMTLTSEDVILALAGTNDYGNGSGTALGVLGDDHTANTFYGDTDYVINTALAGNPALRLLFLTPPMRTDKTAANAAGFKLLDYVTAIKDVCAKYAVPVLDLHHCMGINSLTSATLTVDGLHPNGVGQNWLARMAGAFLNADGTGNALGSEVSSLFFGGAGSATSPQVAVGVANYGMFYSGSALRWTINGVQKMAINAAGFAFGEAADPTGTPIISLVSTAAGPFSGNATMQMHAEVAANNLIWRTSANASGPAMNFRKGRGTIASEALPATSDTLGAINWQAADGAGASVAVASLTAIVIETTPSATHMGTSLRLSAAAIGASTVTEVARLEPGTGLSMFGANPVIDQNRVLRLRSYTIATLPAASTAAGQTVYCSDLGGGGGALVSDGTHWQRTSSGQQTVATDADLTLTALTSAENQKHTGTLTANRTVTLSTTAAYAGAVLQVARTGSGAFNLSLGGLKNLTTGTWAEVIFDGTAWYLAADGTI